jgi:hypothetical protein
VVNSLKPLKLKLDGEQSFRLDRMLVFTGEDNLTVLSLIGPRGTLNIRLGAKTVAGLACMPT